MAITAILAILLTLTPLVHAQSAMTGVIEGVVQNGTPGGPTPAGAVVTLHAVFERSRIGEWKVAADAEGRYRFDGLDTNPSIVYLPIVEYGGVGYFPPRPANLGEQPTQRVDLTVYDTTSRDDQVAFERLAMFVLGVEPNALAVRQMGSVVNVGQQTVVAAGESEAKTVLRFHLPAGAAEVQPESGFLPGDLFPLPDGFGSASPILPGRRQIAFSYLVGFAGERVELSTRLQYPTQTFMLYVPEVGLKVSSPQLVPQGTMQLGGQSYQAFVGQDLPRDTDLRVELTGLPGAADAGLMVNAWYFVAGGALLAVGFALAVVRPRRSTLQATPAAAGAQAASDVLVALDERAELERVRLLLEVARLDERHEAGQLPDEEYERQRTAAKAKLVAMRRAALSGDGRG